jgi:hypothetical protein
MQQVDPSYVANQMQSLRERVSLDAARRFWFEVATPGEGAGETEVVVIVNLYKSVNLNR